MATGTLASSRRPGQGAFQRPAALQSVQQRVGTQAASSRPLRQIVRLAVKCQAVIRALVVHLLDACRPAHIARFVMAVRIDAVNRMLARWTKTDVRQKRREVIAPFIADADAAPAVMPKAFVRWIIASLFHLAPRPVFGRLAHAVGGEPSHLNLTPQAPATSSSAIYQRGTLNACSLAAFAAAEPISAIGWIAMQHCQATKRAAIQVVSLCHVA